MPLALKATNLAPSAEEAIADQTFVGELVCVQVKPASAEV
jgi:hypothetical protein